MLYAVLTDMSLTRLLSGMKQLMAGGGIALIGMVLVPVLGRTSDQGGRMGLPSFFVLLLIHRTSRHETG